MKQLAPGIAWDAESGQRVTDVLITVQGLDVPLHTPLTWLCDNCAHPDDFVYISLVKTRPVDPF